MSARTAIAAAACAWALLVPAATSAAWTRPAVLDGADATAPQLASCPGGGCLAVIWLRSAGDTPTLLVAEERGDGGWMAPLALSTAGAVTLPTLTVNRGGGAVAAWLREDTGAVQVAARRSTSGGWGAPQTLGSGVVQSPPSAALAANGDAVVAWVASGEGGGEIRVALRSGWTGAWVGRSLSANGDAIEPQAAIADNGAAVVVWHRFDGGSDLAEAAFRPAGGDWLTADALSAPGDAVAPAVVIDASGAATAVWGARDADGLTAIRAASRPPQGPWSASTLVAAAQDVPGVVALTVDGSGDVSAAWEGVRALRPVVRAAFRPAGSSFRDPLELAAPGPLSGPPVIAAGPDRRVVASWASVSPEPGVQASVLREGAVVVAAETAAPVAALEATVGGLAEDGTPLLAWVGASGSLQASARDDGPPLVDTLAGPGRIGVGQQATFSVAAHDRWSALAEPVWDLGDGTTAAGATVAHAFAATGTATVRVTIADAAGNATTVARTVEVGTDPVRDLQPPRLSVTPRAFRLDERRRLRVRVGCPATESACFGVARIVLPLPRSQWRQAPLENDERLRPIGERRHLIAAARRFRLAGGETQVLVLRLSPRGAGLVRRARLLEGEIVLVVEDPAGNARSQALRIGLRG